MNENEHDAAVRHDGADGLSLPETASLIDCLIRIRDSHAGMVAFTSADRRLTGILTIGDLLRLAAQRFPLDAPVTERINRNPFTLPSETASDQIVDALLERRIATAPLVDGAGILVGVATAPEHLKRRKVACRAVVMAGGEGVRMRPLTETTAKPMLPLGGRPILERIVERLRRHGLRDIVLTVRYLKEQIVDHFGDGSRFGVRIDYVEETTPRGTCGAVADLSADGEAVLLMNGDLLTDLDFGRLVAFHEDQGADITVAVRDHRFPVPYGVVKLEMSRVVALEEKPEMLTYINAGIYVLSPAARRLIPPDGRYDATTLVTDALANGLSVMGYHMQGGWIDIGAMADYYRACEEFEEKGEE